MKQAELQFAFTTLTESDIHPVLELYRQAILPVWLEHGRDHDFGRIAANMRARLATPDYWMTVARLALDPAAELLGYTAWEKHRDHPSQHTVAHLRMILVRPDQQGSGLGRTLMDHFEAAARAAGCSKVLFDVVAGSAARGFYDSLGYRHWSDYMEKLM